ncbi:hypothetical protein IOC61_01120 [Halomonas sp. KAO]|uniref:hypothetical protein n=1 Tax=unclassified Halomonas TaxID=2609666 RepID=UPI00189CF171|nr:MULTISPECIES: hypothetical protein [unclassified Halomonas]MBF7051918.1 hypothetical protein [Halomonas sp. KAO]MDT0501360.1 hypothetical protein [Halomonas sp. PAR7]MDT0512116.1 hypothetical protein [Halomonas sp. LES1]MDT0590747.1 hypothetical protein [Halomonas sp. PAR8]
MKIKFALAAAIISIVATPALASFGHTESQGRQLTEGINPGGILTSGFPHEYVLSLSESSEVKIASDHFPGSSSITLRMRAKLMSDSGKVIAEADSQNGDFTIDEMLDQGEYRLIVSGDSGGLGDSDMHQYSLHVDIQ